MSLTLIWHPEDAKRTIHKQTKYSDNENKMYKHTKKKKSAHNPTQ